MEVREQVEELLGLLHHEEPLTRRAAAAQLGRLREPSAVEPLIGMVEFQEFADAEGRVAAANALGEIGDPRAVAPLAEVLGRLVRIAGSVAAGITKDLGYGPEDAHAAANGAAAATALAQAIAKIGGPEAQEALRGLAEDEALALAAAPGPLPAEEWYRRLREQIRALRAVATGEEPEPPAAASGTFRVVVVDSYFAAQQAAGLYSALHPGEEARAVIASQDLDGVLSFGGLKEIERPAVLFMARQTLTELEADPELGPRIESVESG